MSGERAEPALVWQIVWVVVLGTLIGICLFLAYLASSLLY